MQLILKVGKPIYQTYFEKNFQHLELKWTLYPKCTNNPSNYTAERHLWIS